MSSSKAVAFARHINVRRSAASLDAALTKGLDDLAKGIRTRVSEIKALDYYKHLTDTRNEGQKQVEVSTLKVDMVISMTRDSILTQTQERDSDAEPRKVAYIPLFGDTWQERGTDQSKTPAELADDLLLSLLKEHERIVEEGEANDRRRQGR
jgi:hypothetical protein